MAGNFFENTCDGRNRGGLDEINVRELEEPQERQLPPVTALLIPTYIANRWKDIEIAGKALQDWDFEALRSMGHTLKGSGGGFGLDEVARVGQEIEASAKEGDPARIAQLLAQLRDFLERVQVFPVREA